MTQVQLGSRNLYLRLGVYPELSFYKYMLPSSVWPTSTFPYFQNNQKIVFSYVSHIPVFLRTKAECFARLSHRLGVCLSVRLSYS